MPERSTRSEAMRAGPRITVGAVILLPIERVVMHSHGSGTHLGFAAAVEPCALVVRDAVGLRAIGTDARAISLDALRAQVPGLDAVLAGL